MLPRFSATMLLSTLLVGSLCLASARLGSIDHMAYPRSVPHLETDETTSIESNSSRNWTQPHLRGVPRPQRPRRSLQEACQAQTDALLSCLSSQDPTAAQACDRCVVDQLPSGDDCNAVDGLCESIQACQCGACESAVVDFLDCSFQEYTGCGLVCEPVDVVPAPTPVPTVLATYLTSQSPSSSPSVSMAPSDAPSEVPSLSPSSSAAPSPGLPFVLCAAEQDALNACLCEAPPTDCEPCLFAANLYQDPNQTDCAAAGPTACASLMQCDCNACLTQAQAYLNCLVVPQCDVNCGYRL